MTNFPKTLRLHLDYNEQVLENSIGVSRLVRQISRKLDHRESTHTAKKNPEKMLLSRLHTPDKYKELTYSPRKLKSISLRVRLSGHIE